MKASIESITSIASIASIPSIVPILSIISTSVGQRGQSRTLGQGQDTSPLCCPFAVFIVRTLEEGQCAKSLLLRQCRCYKGLTGLTSPKGIAHQPSLSLCCTHCPHPRGGTLRRSIKPLTISIIHRGLSNFNSDSLAMSGIFANIAENLSSYKI